LGSGEICAFLGRAEGKRPIRPGVDSVHGCADGGARATLAEPREQNYWPVSVKTAGVVTPVAVAVMVTGPGDEGSV